MSNSFYLLHTGLLVWHLLMKPNPLFLSHQQATPCLIPMGIPKCFPGMTSSFLSSSSCFMRSHERIFGLLWLCSHTGTFLKLCLKVILKWVGNRVSSEKCRALWYQLSIEKLSALYRKLGYEFSEYKRENPCFFLALLSWV